MAVEKGKESCILVGVQIDGDGGDLLRWAITNLTAKGDRLVAVNVSRNPCAKKSIKTSTPSLIKLLDDCLAEHEELCATKRIILDARVAWGSSIKKALVKEAGICSAETVVVGTNKNWSSGGSGSVAKYCANKLPPTTALIAVHKGKIIFERRAAKLRLSGGQHKPNLMSFLHPSISMDAKVLPLNSRSKSDDESQHHCLIDHGRKNDRRRADSIPAKFKILQETKPGWPLLHKAVAENIEDLNTINEARKMSVVHWAMRLPDRALAVSAQSQVDLVKELEKVLEINSSSCKFFQFEDLKNSTRYFSPENLIGKGGNSQVYRGCLSDGQKVAVKLSRLTEKSSRDFLLEVNIMVRLQHDGVMPLIGICVENSNLISLYSYFSRGSLDKNLHDKRGKAELDWDKRFKVAVEVAEALSYLHDDCLHPVIHRDVKSSNILLSDECKPKLSDFGLAIWAPTNAPYILTHSDVVGTFGYIAPEYFMYGKMSSKIDVYAYGVVLLELLTGRKPINDKSPKGQESLVMWATPILERGEIMEIVDPNLDGIYEEIQMKRMALAASLCLRRSAHNRPRIQQILKLLLEGEEIKPWISTDYANNNLVERNWQDEEEEEEEEYPESRIGSLLSISMLGMDDDVSMMSFDQNNLNSLDEYLKER